MLSRLLIKPLVIKLTLAGLKAISRLLHSKLILLPKFNRAGSKVLVNSLRLGSSNNNYAISRLT
jgi:hypothetical protein